MKLVNVVIGDMMYQVEEEDLRGLILACGLCTVACKNEVVVIQEALPETKVSCDSVRGALSSSSVVKVSDNVVTIPLLESISRMSESVGSKLKTLFEENELIREELESTKAELNSVRVRIAERERSVGTGKYNDQRLMQLRITAKQCMDTITQLQKIFNEVQQCIDSICMV